MLTFFKVLMHFLYFAVIAVIEFGVWSWLMPILGAGVTAFILIVLSVVFIMIYAAIFWNWRPSGSGGGDFFSDIGDFGDFS